MAAMFLCQHLGAWEGSACTAGASTPALPAPTLTRMPMMGEEISNLESLRHV
jgi:hypothetical protein